MVHSTFVGAIPAPSKNGKLTASKSRPTAGLGQDHGTPTKQEGLPNRDVSKALGFIAAQQCCKLEEQRERVAFASQKWRQKTKYEASGCSVRRNVGSLLNLDNGSVGC